MRVVPRTLNGKISFYAGHVPKWAEDPQAIGSTPEQIAQLQDLVDAAKDAYEQQLRARRAAQSATARLKGALDKLDVAGSSAITRIRGTAGPDGAVVYIKAL